MPRAKSRLQRGAGRNFSITTGPFEGVNDTADPAGADWTKYLQYAVNYWRRPGSVTLEVRPPFSGAHYRAAQTGICRLLFQWIKKDGTNAPIGAFDNAGTVKFVNLATGADVTPTTFTFASGGGQMFAIMYNDQAIVTDGSAPPMRCDFSAAAANTKIDFGGLGSPEAAYGAPWIYQAKLFFIRKSDRLKILWSEENDAATGYIQTNFTNFWSFAQTSYEPLCAGLGTNERIYLFRARSIDGLMGNADGSFSAYATVDGISTEIGCPLASCIAAVGANIYFLDMYGNLHAIVPGPSVIDYYMPARNTVGSNNYVLSDGSIGASVLPFRQLAYWEEADLLIHQAIQNSVSQATFCHAWQESGKRYLGTWWDGGTAAYNYGMITTVTSVAWTQIGVLRVSDGFNSSTRKLFRADNAFATDVMTLGAPVGQANPIDPSGAVTTQAITGPLFFSDEVDCLFEEAVISFDWNAAQAGTLTFWTQYQTSLHPSAAVATPGTTTTGTTTNVPAAQITGQVRDGLKARGRSIQYLIQSGYQTVDGSKNPWHRLQQIRIDGCVVGNKSEGNVPTSVWSLFVP